MLAARHHLTPSLTFSLLWIALFHPGKVVICLLGKSVHIIRFPPIIRLYLRYEDFSFWYNYDHTYFDGCMIVDMICLKSPRLRQWIKDNKVDLINFMDAVNGTHKYQDHLKKIGSDLYMGSRLD